MRIRLNLGMFLARRTFLPSLRGEPPWSRWRRLRGWFWLTALRTHLLLTTGWRAAKRWDEVADEFAELWKGPRDPGEIVEISYIDNPADRTATVSRRKTFKFLAWLTLLRIVTKLGRLRRRKGMGDGPGTGIP